MLLFPQASKQRHNLVCELCVVWSTSNVTFYNRHKKQRVEQYLTKKFGEIPRVGVIFTVNGQGRTDGKTF